METENPSEDYEYYNQKLKEELENLEVDLQNIKKLAIESLIAFIYQVAEKIGLATDKFLEWFGPLFHDTTQDNNNDSEGSAEDENQ